MIARTEENKAPAERTECGYCDRGTCYEGPTSFGATYAETCHVCNGTGMIWVTA